jgi:two-component system, cell cycle sensor histidine kinase and response regulator CckA
MSKEDRTSKALEQAVQAGGLSRTWADRIRAAADADRALLTAVRMVAMSEEDAVRYRVISELATDWVYAARRDERTQQLWAEWATDALQEITGYTVEELNERGGLQALVLKEDVLRLAVDDPLLPLGQPTVVDYRITTKQGELRWLRDYRRPELDASGTRVVRLFGAVKDISSQKRAEEALRDAMRQLEQRVGTEVARFRSLLDQAGESIFVLDPRTLGLLDVNDTACRELGYQREELLTMNMNQIAMSGAPWNSLEQGQLSDRRVSVEQLYRRKNGDEFPVEVTVSLPRFIGLDYLVVVAREISERKQMETQLAQAGRLASVGLLAAGVAHEVNNPLAYIMNNITYAIANLPDHVEDVACALREARTGAERVRDIVQGLKTFSRSDDEKIVPTDVCRLLDSAIRVAHNEIRHRALLVRDYDHVPPVEADGRLVQVFLNLIVNATHAIHEGDVQRNRITVSARHLAETNEVAVQVSDTGIGIPPERLGKIFDPFYTTKPIGVGTGLGLSICRNITTSMGGRIDVVSEVGTGSTFTVTLRCSRAQVADSNSDSVHPPAELNRALRVLVVDDDLFVGRSLRRLLKPQHEVTLATSGRQALTLLNDATFDVVFCDVMMPEMTGLELHAAVGRENPDLARRFVFITGGPFTPEARQLFDEVANPCLQKPFSRADLAGVLVAVAGPGNESGWGEPGRVEQGRQEQGRQEQSWSGRRW